MNKMSPKGLMIPLVKVKDKKKKLENQSFLLKKNFIDRKNF